MFTQENNKKGVLVLILSIALVILLGFGNLYFYEKAKKPEISQTIPDLTIWFSDQKQKILYYSVNVWFTKDSIIFESSQEQERYKIINDDRAEVIKKIIEKGS